MNEDFPMEDLNSNMDNERLINNNNSGFQDRQFSNNDQQSNNNYDNYNGNSDSIPLLQNENPRQHVNTVPDWAQQRAERVHQAQPGPTRPPLTSTITSFCLSSDMCGKYTWLIVLAMLAIATGIVVLIYSLP
eukprot:UN02854